jgi:Uma2 family endonuclease
MSAILIDVKKITYSEFRQMEFDDNDPYIYELINGILVKKSAPQPRHQRISRKLLRLMDDFIQKNSLGEIFYAPIDVFLDDVNVPQPDLVFVSNERSSIIDDKDGILGVPDLVVEIISPSSIRLDRVDKKELYEGFCVPEYWLIDPKNTAIEIFYFQNGRYKSVAFANELSDKVASTVLAGFEVVLSDIF